MCIRDRCVRACVCVCAGFCFSFVVAAFFWVKRHKPSDGVPQTQTFRSFFCWEAEAVTDSLFYYAWSWPCRLSLCMLYILLRIFCPVSVLSVHSTTFFKVPFKNKAIHVWHETFIWDWILLFVSDSLKKESKRKHCSMLLTMLNSFDAALFWHWMSIFLPRWLVLLWHNVHRWLSGKK